jgi:hypothetical protein
VTMMLKDQSIVRQRIDPFLMLVLVLCAIVSSADARNISLQLTSGGSGCGAEPHGGKESVTCTFSSNGIE